jgi:transposase
MTWRPKPLTRSQGEERRLAAGQRLQASSLAPAEIARRLGVSRMAVSQWAKHLRPQQGALASLRSRPTPGRPSRLTAAQWQHLVRLLKHGALRAGFETDRWTLRRLRAVIVVECGVDDHAHYLARRLKSLGWSPQPPAGYARERDEALIKVWRQHDWPRITKSAPPRGHHHRCG